MAEGPDSTTTEDRFTGPPLRIALLVKQVPAVDSLRLGPDGRLERQGMVLEMNTYCRRAVAKGVELARASGGSCTVFTLGPPSAEDVLREAIAWGADRGFHLCDPAFAGSDTLATARALASALERCGPFDLVLVGRNSTDGETGQVGPELAELIGTAFASGVRHLERAGGELALQLEHDDGAEQVLVRLPAVLSVAERLCEPCKVPPQDRQAVPADRIKRLGAAALGPGPWGIEGSPTQVGAVRVLGHGRAKRRLSGSLGDQVAEAVAQLASRGALRPAAAARLRAGTEPGSARRSVPSRTRQGTPAVHSAPSPQGSVVVVVEEGRPQVAAELLGAARSLATGLGTEVVAFSRTWEPDTAGPRPAPDHLVVVAGAEAGDDVAGALVGWARKARPKVVLAPSTAYGREVAGRAAAALGAGLIGDAIGLTLEGGSLVAAKPAFSGALVAEITCTSAISMVTVRPGVLPVPAVVGPIGEGGARGSGSWSANIPCELIEVVPRRRVISRSTVRDDDVEVLARASAVIGVGTGVHPDEYTLLDPLAALLGAEMAATRKVTDRGWVPRSRQVGITGRSIAPQLYVAMGLSGKFNHMVGVRRAGTVLAVNIDPDAPVFEHADVGIVGDWHDVLPLLEMELVQQASSEAMASAEVMAACDDLD